MGSKDKLFGGIIFAIGLIMIVFYIFWGPVNLYYSHHLAEMEGGVLDGLYTGLEGWGFNWEWAVVLPLTLIVVLVGLLAAWIGISMITTPAPVPLEELEEELEAEEAASEAKE
jgi:hypothetical protein